VFLSARVYRDTGVAGFTGKIRPDEAEAADYIYISIPSENLSAVWEQAGEELYIPESAGSGAREGPIGEGGLMGRGKKPMRLVKFGGSRERACGGTWNHSPPA
jgi:hypothetical protein